MRDQSVAVSINSSIYPRNLASIDSPPSPLFVIGKFTGEDSKAVAIVGTRTPTPYGKEVTKLLTSSLSCAGVTIISGLARGIDTIAHETALKSGGRTIAVLGGGLSYIYPHENLKLANQIVESGALVSQFADNVAIKPEYFLSRNRVIAGLSLCVVVIEGQARSGTLSTATHAANIGREVFAVPGPITSPFSAAPHFLIREGARIVTSPEDILSYVEGL